MTDLLDASGIGIINNNNHGDTESEIPKANAAVDNDVNINGDGKINPLSSVNNQGEKKDDKKKKKKKKVGPFNFFRAALVALRGDNKKKSAMAPTKSDKQKVEDNNAIVNASSNGNWKNIVGSMRPLHLQQDDQSPPPQQMPTTVNTAGNINLDEEDQNNNTISISMIHPLMMIKQHQQPSSPSSSSSVSGGTMSQYASANNLQALLDDDSEEDDDPDVVFDAICGDEMIDSKAEEFIAQFYHQMKIDHHHLHNRGKSHQL